MVTAIKEGAEQAAVLEVERQLRSWGRLGEGGRAECGGFREV